MNVGDYVRLDRCQGINKIEEYDEDIKKYKLEDVIGDEWGDETFILDENDVIKSSPNIIDLIEVGDYVNGYKVLFAGATTWDNDGNVIDKRVKINYDGYDRWLSEDFIKSIVTKECFESMEYKVGE